MKRVENTAHMFNLWKPKQSFILGISGGTDSVCLLDVFSSLARKHDFRLHIAHVNYRLRGKDSDCDEAFVKTLATQYDIPCTVFCPPKTSFAKSEESYRDLRYHFFETLRQEKNYDHIVVAHHRDDQAETFLLRLLRGSGMTGLRAMRPKNNFIIRPLLDVTRADILQYLKERKISYRIDTSNTDRKFLRNRVRHDLIPLLERKYQPNIKKILADTATLLAHDYALLETRALSSSQKSNDPLTFSVQALLSIPHALLCQKLRLLLKPFFLKKSPPKGVIDEILKLLRSTKNKHQAITAAGLKLERKGDTVRLLNFQK